MITLDSNKLFVIAGPCVIESTEVCLAIGRYVKEICDRLGFTYIFKASFDKANRSSINSFRGPGLEDGLIVLQRIKDELGVPVLTDVHECGQVAEVATVVDILQVPAFLARHVLSRGYSWLSRLLLDLDVSDTESGFKFFERIKIHHF